MLKFKAKLFSGVEVISLGLFVRSVWLIKFVFGPSFAVYSWCVDQLGEISCTRCAIFIAQIPQNNKFITARISRKKDNTENN